MFYMSIGVAISLIIALGLGIAVGFMGRDIYDKVTTKKYERKKER